MGWEQAGDGSRAGVEMETGNRVTGIWDWEWQGMDMALAEWDRKTGNRAKDTGKAQGFGIGKGEEDGNRAGGVGYGVMV